MMSVAKKKEKKKRLGYKFSRVYHKRLFECSPELIKQFKRLNFGYNGMMRRLLDDGAKFVDSWVFYIYDQDGAIAGWAISCRDDEEGYDRVTNYYVKGKYRRLGLGTRLMKYMAEYHPKIIKGKRSDKVIKYIAHDPTSGEFFRSCWGKKILNRKNAEWDDYW